PSTSRRSGRTPCHPGPSTNRTTRSVSAWSSNSSRWARNEAQREAVTMSPRGLLMVPLLVVLAWPAAAQDAALPVPPGDKDPALRLEGRGPLGPVQGVAFGPGGATLYEAGWDKVVRVWRRDARTGQFSLDPSSTLRIPIGPGDAGVLQALAVSADGAWL